MRKVYRGARGRSRIRGPPTLGARQLELRHDLAEVPPHCADDAATPISATTLGQFESTTMASSPRLQKNALGVNWCRSPRPAAPMSRPSGLKRWRMRLRDDPLLPSHKGPDNGQEDIPLDCKRNIVAIQPRQQAHSPRGPSRRTPIFERTRRPPRAADGWATSEGDRGPEITRARPLRLRDRTRHETSAG